MDWKHKWQNRNLLRGNCGQRLILHHVLENTEYIWHLKDIEPIYCQPALVCDVQINKYNKNKFHSC